LFAGIGFDPCDIVCKTCCIVRHLFGFLETNCHAMCVNNETELFLVMFSISLSDFSTSRIHPEFFRVL
jgi:hypothetical protein